jgi:anti-sigma factor RsiW
MSHLGRRLSALIDGELSDSERDQAHAHLVGCDECRAEAAALRTLKRRVRGLGETPADGALTRRLIALGGLPESAPSRSRPPGASRDRAARTVFPGAAARQRGWDGLPDWLADGSAHQDASPLAAPPLGGGHAAAGRARGHTRYVVAGAVAALAVSLGAASFAAGGGGHSPGPTVSPEVDVYMMQHAVTAGSIPMVPPDGQLTFPARP